jgi:RHS repeat-associated protein
MLKNLLGFSLAFLISLTSLPSNAINGVVPELEATSIKCNDGFKCLGNLSIRKKVFEKIVDECLTVGTQGCTNNTYYTTYSNSNDELLTAFINGLNARQSNYSKTRYTPLQNCVIRTEGTLAGSMSCDYYREVYTQAENGTSSWIRMEINTASTIVRYNPPENICSQAGTVYLAGLGCTSSATARTVSAIPNNCGTCLEQSMNSAMYPGVGNPISVNSATKVELKQDLSFPFSFVRNYSSARTVSNNMGLGWKHNYDKRLSIVQAQNLNEAGTYNATLIFTEENDSEVIFTRLDKNAVFYPAFKDLKGYSVVLEGNDYVLTTPNGNKEKYNANGHLIQLLYQNGYYLNFSYNATNLLSGIVDPYGRNLTLTYIDGVLNKVQSYNNDKVEYLYTVGNLTSATFNTTEKLTYGYTNNKLASITNENNKLMSVFAYDAQGRAIETKGLANANTYIHQFNMDYSGGVNSYKATKGNGGTIAYNMSSVNYKKVINSSVITDAAINKKTSYGFSYDLNGFPKTYKDGKSNITDFVYSDNGQLISVKRPDDNETVYSYYPDTNMVQTSSETTENGIRNTSYLYDSNYNLTQTTVETQGTSRTFSNTYTTFGRVSSSTEPNSSSTSYEYYADDDASIDRRGLLKKVTNALSQSVEITSYDNRGNPTTIVDQNNVSKTMTYDARSRIKTETVGNATNYYNYDLAGNLLNTTFANGLTLTFTYDHSHRLTSVSDNNGNSQLYVLDSDNDQPTNITIKNNNVLNNVTNQVFDKLGRLNKLYRSNVNEYRQFSYDDNNNVVTDRNANGNSNTYYYNNLNQVSSTSGPDGSPSYTYNLDGNVKTATLNSKKTTYDFNDFGEMTSLISPETGTTTINYDVAQNLTTKTDANNITHIYQTDALGRMVSANHNSGVTSEVETFTYDTAINGIGKVASIMNSHSTIGYEYDALGRVSKKIETVGTQTHELSYGYNNVGQLSSITYPSGVVVNYVYTKGLITSVNLSGAVVGTVLHNAVYQPFDSNFPKNYTFNTNKNRIVNFDTDEKLTSLNIDGVASNTFVIDGEGNYLNILDAMNNTNSLIATYDVNNKIKTFTQNVKSFQASYDNGYNRISSTNTISAQNLTFTYHTTTNRLTSYKLNNVVTNITYDNNGNTLTDGTAVYTYDLRNNLVSFTKAGDSGTYTFNALGQRVTKTVNGVTTYFMYDDATNLIGEYDSNGNAISEHIYLNNVPVGLVKDNLLYYVHTDHLGTPRTVTNNANNVVWQWNNTDPFGANLPTVDTITYNKRFAGQYFDNESKLHYNYYRTYNPLLGRYVQSDPLGLAAGFNTYSYVGSNPLGAVDPLGLYSSSDFINDAADFAAGYGDSVSYGGTKAIRDLFDIGSVDYSSNTYAAGGYTDVALGVLSFTASWKMNKLVDPMRGKAGKKLADKVRSRSQATSNFQNKKSANPKCEIHHTHPLVGHPGLTTRKGKSYASGRRTLFPTGGLPTWINSSRFNLKAYSPTEHRLVHGDLIELENFWSIYHHPAHSTIKLLNNIFYNQD